MQSPNFEHVKFAQQWIDAFPDARSYACPGLREQEPDIAFHETIGAGPPPPQWPEEVRAAAPLAQHSTV